MKYAVKTLVAFLSLCCSGILISGCDQVELQEHEPAAISGQVSLKSSVPDTCTGMGNYQAVFDDFSYSDTNFDADSDNNNEGSLFGDNTWSTCADGVSDTTTSRMWYRYNHTDAGVNANAKYVLSDAGTYQAKLALRMELEYDPSASHHHPIIRSGLKTREGTYAARVQFSELEDDALLIQSFWLQNGPDETHAEADVEWNNWFDLPQENLAQTGESYVHVTNHYNGKKSALEKLDGRYYDGSTGHEAHNLEDANDHSYVIGEAGNGGNPRNEWWTIVINVTSSTVKYSMQNDGYGNQPGTVWAGKGVEASDWEKPKEISSHHPVVNLPSEQGLNSQFGFLFTNDSSHYFVPPKSALSKEAEMLVEWFYYSPEQLSLAQVQDQVNNQIDRNTHSRFNTTDYSLEF
jgi:hypothetical protein